MDFASVYGLCVRVHKVSFRSCNSTKLVIILHGELCCWEKTFYSKLSTVLNQFLSFNCEQRILAYDQTVDKVLQFLVSLNIKVLGLLFAKLNEYASNFQLKKLWFIRVDFVQTHFGGGNDRQTTNNKPIYFTAKKFCWFIMDNFDSLKKYECPHIFAFKSIKNLKLCYRFHCRCNRKGNNTIGTQLPHNIVTVWMRCYREKKIRYLYELIYEIR